MSHWGLSIDTGDTDVHLHRAHFPQKLAVTLQGRFKKKKIYFACLHISLGLLKKNF